MQEREHDPRVVESKVEPKTAYDYFEIWNLDDGNLVDDFQWFERDAAVSAYYENKNSGYRFMLIGVRADGEEDVVLED